MECTVSVHTHTLYHFASMHCSVHTHAFQSTERPACELIQCITSLKSSVWSVTFFDPELVVSTVQVNGTEDSVLRDSIDGVINARQRKRIQEGKLMYRQWTINGQQTSFCDSHFESYLRSPRRVAWLSDSFLKLALNFSVNEFPVFVHVAVPPWLGGNWINIRCQISKEMRGFNFQCTKATDFKRWLGATMMKTNTRMLRMKSPVWGLSPNTIQER